MAKGILDDKRVLALILAAGRARPILAASGDPKALVAARGIDAALIGFGPEVFSADDLAVFAGLGSPNV